MTFFRQRAAEGCCQGQLHLFLLCFGIVERTRFGAASDAVFGGLMDAKAAGHQERMRRRMATTEESKQRHFSKPSEHGVPRLTHGAKVKRGQLNAVQQGRYGTGPAPYGYRRGDDGERPLVIDDREAEVVRIIFREYLRTRSTGKVVEYLHGKKIYTRKGKRWSRQAIAIILSNRTYRGRVSYGDIETQGVHAPIIEPALFYKAHALKERKRRTRKGASEVDEAPRNGEAFDNGEH